MEAAPNIQTVEVRTSLGVVPVTGTFGRPLTVLAINGLAAGPDEMSRLPLVVTPHGGVVGFLPGDRNPALAETSISAFSRAFDEVVAHLGPTVVLGLSVGALVALGMRSPQIVAVIAVEPPLNTGKLWPFLPELRAGLSNHHRAVVESVFGVSSDGVEGRDYSSLLDGLHRQTDVVIGGEPLMPERAISRMPSFVDLPERAVLAAHPRVSLHIAPNAGHNIPAQASAVLLPILHAACERARTAW